MVAHREGVGLKQVEDFDAAHAAGQRADGSALEKVAGVQVKNLTGIVVSKFPHQARQDRRPAQVRLHPAGQPPRPRREPGVHVVGVQQDQPPLIPRSRFPLLEGGRQQEGGQDQCSKHRVSHDALLLISLEQFRVTLGGGTFVHAVPLSAATVMDENRKLPRCDGTDSGSQGITSVSRTGDRKTGRSFS